MDGMNIDPQILIDTQANTIAQNSIRMTQLEAAVQQLAKENAELRAQIPSDTEKSEDVASAN